MFSALDSQQGSGLSAGHRMCVGADSLVLLHGVMDARRLDTGPMRLSLLLIAYHKILSPTKAHAM